MEGRGIENNTPDSQMKAVGSKLYGLSPEPPWRVIVSPVMYAASFDARNTQVRPMSSTGSAKRPRGMSRMVFANSSG